MRYKYHSLLKKRRELDLKIEEIAKKLTLSTTQIKSLEQNKKLGFINEHYLYISLKRYADLLEIDLDKLIYKDKDNNLDGDEDLLQSPQPLKKIKRNTFFLLFFVILLFVYLIYFFDNLEVLTDDLEKDNKPLSIQSSNNINIDQNQYNESPMIEMPEKHTASKESLNNSLDFLCTIKSTSVKNFYTKDPEKPSNYFHIISLKKQSICIVDKNEILKQYNIEEGGKVTHFGEAPFKIQLDPALSELYFEGWKVRLKENDNFIKLNPNDNFIKLNPQKIPQVSIN